MNPCSAIVKVQSFRCCSSLSIKLVHYAEALLTKTLLVYFTPRADAHPGF